MRIAFMGSGGLGGYFGARLCSGGAEVHFIARGRHLQAMRSQGLRVEGPDAVHLPRVNATDDPGEVGVVDFVMLCVKLWDTETALQQIRPMVGPATTIISFQNGVLKDQYLRAAYDESQIMGGVGYVATTIDRPGVLGRPGARRGPGRGLRRVAPEAGGRCGVRHDVLDAPRSRARQSPGGPLARRGRGGTRAAQGRADAAQPRHRRHPRAARCGKGIVSTKQRPIHRSCGCSGVPCPP